MKWTETVLVARRQSDGAFYYEDNSWSDSPDYAKRFNAPSDLKSWYDDRFVDAEIVKLTITYEVDDDRV